MPDDATPPTGPDSGPGTPDTVGHDDPAAGRRRERGARTPTVRRGAVLPTGVVLLSLAAMVMAALAYFTVGEDGPTPPDIAQPVRTETSDSPEASPEPDPEPTRREPKPVIRAEVPVEVYNNTSEAGLAADVGTQATEAGWDVVGTDNWFGTIADTTVYFPPKMKRAANQLALDLGVDNVEPAVEPMKLDRLTLILTGAI